MEISQEEYNKVVVTLHEIEKESKRMQKQIDCYEISARESSKRWNELFDNDLVKAFDTSMSHEEFRHSIQMICIDYEYCIVCGSFDCMCCECE